MSVELGPPTALPLGSLDLLRAVGRGEEPAHPLRPPDRDARAHARGTENPRPDGTAWCMGRRQLERAGRTRMA